MTTATAASQKTSVKIVVLASRILLGLLFIVFGLNGFLHFTPQPTPPPGLARDYFVTLISSNYLALPFALQVIAGALLLLNRYVPLALALLAPVIVNILMFHVLMLPAGLPPGLLATLFWFVVAYNVRSSFAGIFAARGAA